MTRPERGTLKGAMARAIRILGAEVCAEITGLSTTSVWRFANPNEPHVPSAQVALELDRRCWIEEGIAPFREVFEANAGEGPDARLARRLRAMADEMEVNNG